MSNINRYIVPEFPKKRLIMIAILCLIAFKFLIYDGFATCNPIRYRGTCIGVILGYDSDDILSRKKEFDRMIAPGMESQKLTAMLNEQGVHYVLGKVYQYTPVPAPDYVISFRTEFICIHGEYRPGFRVWIKDEKVYQSDFYVERTLI